MSGPHPTRASRLAAADVHAWMAGLLLLLGQRIRKGPRPLGRKQPACATQHDLHEGRGSSRLTSAQVAGSVGPGPAGSEGRVAFLQEHFETRNDSSGERGGYHSARR